MRRSADAAMTFDGASRLASLRPTFPMRIFFVGGAPKSGTTWMQRAIDAHPRAVCSGEGHFLALIAKPMLEMFGTYDEKIEKVNRVVYGDRPYHRPLSKPEAVAIIRETVLSLMARRTTADTFAVGDKTPVYAYVVRDLGIFL